MMWLILRDLEPPSSFMHPKVPGLPYSREFKKSSLHMKKIRNHPQKFIENVTAFVKAVPYNFRGICKVDLEIIPDPDMEDYQ